MAAVSELVSALDAELVRLGYKPSTLKWYRGCWRRLERWLDDLLRRVTASLHRGVPSSPIIQGARNSHKGRTDPPGSGHGGPEPAIPVVAKESTTGPGSGDSDVADAIAGQASALRPKRSSALTAAPGRESRATKVGRGQLSTPDRSLGSVAAMAESVPSPPIQPDRPGDPNSVMYESAAPKPDSGDRAAADRSRTQGGSAG